MNAAILFCVFALSTAAPRPNKFHELEHEILEIVEKQLEHILGQSLGALGAKRNVLGDIGEGVGKFAKGFVEGVVGKRNVDLESALAAKRNVLGDIGEGVGKFAKGFVEGVVGKRNVDLESALAAKRSVLGDIGEGVGKFAKGFVEGVVGKRNVLTDIGEGFKDFGNGVVKGFVGKRNLLTDIGNGFKDFGNGVVKGFVGKRGDLDLKTLLALLEKDKLTATRNSKRMLVDIEQIGKSVGGIAKGVLIGAAAAAVGKRDDSLHNEKRVTIEEVGSTVGGIVKNVLIGAAAAALGKREDERRNFFDNIKNAFETVEKGVVNIAKGALPVVEGLAKEALPLIEELAPTLISTGLNALVGKRDVSLHNEKRVTVEEVGRTVGDIVKNVLIGAAGAALGRREIERRNFFDEIKNAFETVEKGVVNIAKGALPVVEGLAKEALPIVEKLAPTLISTGLNALVGKRDVVTDFEKAILKKLLE